MHPKIKILTLNIFCRPFGIFSNRFGDKKIERVKEFLSFLDAYDIVCLQEIFSTWDSGRVSNLIHRAKEIGFPFAHYCAGKNWFRPVDSGLLILSRYELLNTDSFFYCNGTGADRFASKGVLYAKLNLPQDKSAHLFTTHLQYKSYEKVQKSQIQKLAHFVSEKTEKEPNLPIILTGDFNINSFKKLEKYQFLVQALAAQGFKVVDAMYEKLEKHPVTDGYGHGVIHRQVDKMPIRGRCVDYVFLLYRDEVVVGDEVIDAAGVEPFFVENAQGFNQVSDHFGVWASINVQEI